MTYLLELVTKGSGFFVNETAGEALAIHTLVYRDAVGTWSLADADAAASMPVIGLTMEAITSGSRGLILLQGYIGDISWTWTSGGEIYASSTPGALTQTAPIHPVLFQQVAVAISPTFIDFNPNMRSGSFPGNVTVRRNSGVDVGTRPRINVIDGANITTTIVDDGVSDEIDITIASVGGGGDLSQWFPASDPDDFKGTHPSMIMTDGLETLIRQSFVIPASITTITTAAVVIIPDGSGNLDWSVATNFGQLCANEQYDANTDTASGTTAVTSGEIECIDISAALTGAAARELIGIEFTRDGDDALDTVNADVHFIGIWIEGT